MRLKGSAEVLEARRQRAIQMLADELSLNEIARRIHAVPRPFTEPDRARIQAKLIAAGKRILNAAGIRLLVVDDVARKAGISKGSFYSFYPSREEFILSVFESWETEYRGALIREVTNGGTPRGRIERFFLGAFEILERQPGLAKLG